MYADQERPTAAGRLVIHNYEFWIMNCTRRFSERYRVWAISAICGSTPLPFPSLAVSVTIRRDQWLLAVGRCRSSSTAVSACIRVDPRFLVAAARRCA